MSSRVQLERKFFLDFMHFHHLPRGDRIQFLHVTTQNPQIAIPGRFLLQTGVIKPLFSSRVYCVTLTVLPSTSFPSLFRTTSNTYE